MGIFLFLADKAARQLLVSPKTKKASGLTLDKNSSENNSVEDNND